MNKKSVLNLVDEGIIYAPMDGNHGEIHPKSSDFVSSGIPFVMANDIENSRVNYDRCKFITPAQADKLRKGFSVPGDVLITHKATIGRTAMNDYTAADYIMLTPQVTFYRIKDTKKLDAKYLKYYFDTSFFQDTMKKWAGAGSTRAYIGITQQLNLPIVYPAISIQKNIANVLAALDDKIALNHKINAELEQMARTLYDHWFVQFDFPDASGKPYKSSGGTMKFSPELNRQIPKAWTIRRLDEVEPSVVTGKTPSTKERSNFDGSIPFICIGDIRGNMHVVSTALKLSVKGAESQRKKYIPRGSLCVTCIASPGLVGFATEESQTNQQINSIVFGNKHNKYLLYFYLKDFFRFSSAKSGNTFANMNKEDFSSIPVIVPEPTTLEKFHKIASPIGEKILMNSRESQKLAHLRDWLLPMLMNGQVTVK